MSNNVFSVVSEFVDGDLVYRRQVGGYTFAEARQALLRETLLWQHSEDKGRLCKPFITRG